MTINRAWRIVFMAALIYAATMGSVVWTVATAAMLLMAHIDCIVADWKGE